MSTFMGSWNPLEVVASQDIGRGEGIDLMGRGWLGINTIKKHYLSLTQRSERFQKLMQQVQQYSTRFNGISFLPSTDLQRQNA